MRLKAFLLMVFAVKICRLWKAMVINMKEGVNLCLIYSKRQFE